MKRRFSLLFLCIAMVLSGLGLAAYGAHLKYQVLLQHDLGQEYNIIELPFVLETDHELQYLLRLAQTPPEPTTEPTAAPTTEPTTVPTTVPETVPVTEPTTAPTTEPAYASLCRESVTFQVAGALRALYDGTADIADVTFSSDNEAVVTFVDGVATATGEGSTLIHADYAGTRISCAVTCKLLPPENRANRYPYHDFSVGVPDEWFENTLFIGDSRTRGMQRWGRCGSADYFCDVGLTVYSALNPYTKLSDENFTDMSLEELLSTRTYDKVFINLGLNERGKGQDMVEPYTELLGLIKRYQPDCIIILQGILHTTEAFTAANDYCSPHFLERLNGYIRELADWSTVFYIDANPYFTDSSQYLYTEMSGDGCHFSAKYYAIWSQWLRYAVAALDIP